MNKRNILIIEDDLGIREVTKFSLEIDGHWRVATAYCGKEGLSKAQGMNFDAILLDLVMPDMGGVEILRKLQENETTNNIPVILFTARLIEEEIVEFKGSNVIGFINKPFDSLTLSDKITTILDRQHQVV